MVNRNNVYISPFILGEPHTHARTHARTHAHTHTHTHRKHRWQTLARYFFFFSCHYTTRAQCWVQDLARGLNSFRSSWVQGCGRMGQTCRCFIVCSSPHLHIVCPSSLNPHFCTRDLHRPVPVRRLFRLDQVGHASLELGGSDSSD